MKFGIGIRKALSGAGLYVMIFQIASLLPAVYIVIASGYMGIFAKTGVFSVLFDLGASAIPRWEALCVSLLYRLTSSEVAVHFALLGGALAFGFAAAALLRGEYRTARVSRIVFAALICADLILRLLPFHFNIAFGWPAAAVGVAVRLFCLALLLLDLRADRKNRAAAPAQEG